MDLAKLEKEFNEIVSRRNELSQLDYNDEKYDELEDEMHDLEDDFNEAYGETLEDFLGDVHEDVKIDTDILLPISYILPKYVEVNGQIEIGPEEGVAVESENYSNLNSRLMFLPDPFRLAFCVEGAITKEWDLKHALSNS